MMRSSSSLRRIPINTTADGCAFTIVTRYEGRAYLKSMTGGGGYYPCTGVLEVWSDTLTPRRTGLSATETRLSPASQADTATAQK